MTGWQLARELWLNYAGDIEDKAVDNLISKLEVELREQIAQELENAIIEVAGNSAATMQQAIRIVRRVK